MLSTINQKFWNGKRVMITGHTGFKGSWLSICLRELGAEVIGLGLDPYTEKDNFVLCNLTKKMTDIRGNINDAEELKKNFIMHKPEIVFHMAAQSLVRVSYDFPKETYETNVMGTLNVLNSIYRSDCVKVGVMVTTDKCYENKEQIWGYRETDPLGGYDPYSSSKACAELLISSYRSSFMNPNNYQNHGKAIASVRAGNVIGGGDWSKDRLIPDCIRALENGQPVKIRNPKAVRPWQHVLEPLAGYLILAEKLYEEPVKYARAWNIGPNYDSVKTVWDVCNLLISRYGKGSLKDISNSNKPHEAELLLLDNTQARLELGWDSKIDIKSAINMTIDWYKKYKICNVYNLCKNDILSYFEN